MQKQARRAKWPPNRIARLSRCVCGVLLTLALALCPACSDSAPVTATGNLLVNPGFEQGREPWEKLGGRSWGAFELVSSPVRSGRAAALLPLLAKPGTLALRTRVYGVVQEPSPARFPDRISGWYRVEDWHAESPETKLYLQVVVMVWGDPRIREIVPGAGEGLDNYQIRYYLAGLDEPAFRLANAKLRFVAKGPPRRGEWVRFEIPVRADFERLWGVVPEGFDYLRIMFEGRWDDRPSESSVRAEVYFDDLFFGYDAGPESVAEGG